MGDLSKYEGFRLQQYLKKGTDKSAMRASDLDLRGISLLFIWGTSDYPAITNVAMV